MKNWVQVSERIRHLEKVGQGRKDKWVTTGYQKVWVNLDHIIWIQQVEEKGETFTKMQTAEYSIEVKESPEEILT